MKRLKALLITLVLASLCAAQTAKTKSSAVPAGKATAVSAEMKSLADAEREFAAFGAKTSVRESFPKYFAQDGIIFNPHPAKLHEVFANRPLPKEPPPIILNWAPEYGDIAASGDFGYDTGPSWRVERATGKEVGYGDFFSVWKKQADGSWKVVADVGTQTPDVRKPKDFWQAAPSGWKAKGKTDSAKEKAGIESAEKQFRTVTAKSGLRAGLEQFGDPSLRVWKNGFEPTMDRKQSVMEALPFKQTGDVMYADVANSGDMGYDYGSWKSLEGKDKGFYLHVWRKNRAGQWKIVARVEHVLPPEEKKQ